MDYPGKIHLIQDDGKLIGMSQSPYESEELLQILLSEYPDLLAGDQINAHAPRIWLLVSQETPLPSEHDGPARWSVDHLFLDQDAIPTIVEVKRSTDTRIRREVVGQMLEYAANATTYWPANDLRLMFERRCVKDGLNPDELLHDFLGEDAEPDDYWGKVETNLKTGMLRMLFVSDKIPEELHRIIEFMNTYMSPAEILGVEIGQYKGKGLKALVSRVVGQTAETQARKTQRKTRQWDDVSFFEQAQRSNRTIEAEGLEKIFRWAVDRTLEIKWGTGWKHGTFSASQRCGDELTQILFASTEGYVEFGFSHYSKSSPFSDLDMRKTLMRRLNDIRGINIQPDKLDKYPRAYLANISASGIDQMLSVYDWFLSEIDRHASD